MSRISYTARPFNLKLEYPFGISRGSINIARNVLVTLAFDDILAYGEAAPSSYYGESQDSVIEFLNAFVKNKRIENYLTNIKQLIEDLNYFTSSVYRGSSSSACVALEMAFWDLIGKIENKSLYQFFFVDDPFLSNGRTYDHIKPTSYTIALDKLLVVEEKVSRALKLGYKILKIKLGLSYDEDLNILKTVKNLLKDSSCIIRVDANGGWDIDTLKRMFDVLPSYGVELIEQPLPKGQIRMCSLDIKNSPIPIFADEDCVLANDVEKLAGKVHGVNIKLMKTGSILEAYNMINLARSYNLKIMLGCMIESSCAISASVHLSPLADYVDLDGHLLLERDPFSGLTLENNKIIPSFDSGLGVYFSSD
ncbi:MAG: dipeptide epimerase [Candidatus Melainabacteria bacterium]|nr:dipeptide epimerase [Candidatus Melainabacteria bacterium]